jgi:hypothetical protein
MSRATFIAATVLSTVFVAVSLDRVALAGEATVDEPVASDAAEMPGAGGSPESRPMPDADGVLEAMAVRRMIRDTIADAQRDDDPSRTVKRYLGALEQLAERDVVPADLRARLKELVTTYRDRKPRGLEALGLRQALNSVYGSLAEEERMLRDFEALVGKVEPAEVMADDFTVKEPKPRNVRYGLARVENELWSVRAFQDGNIPGEDRAIRLRVYLDPRPGNAAQRPRMVSAFLRMPDGSALGPVVPARLPASRYRFFQDGPFYLVEFDAATSPPTLTELVVVTQTGDRRHATAHVLRH